MGARALRRWRSHDGAACCNRSPGYVRGNVRPPTGDSRDGEAMTTNRPLEPGFFINRELSWLAFNERVLEEASDLSNPLLERIKFVAITASNLDEFFMVRVASLLHAVAERDTSPDPAGLTPSAQLAAIRTRARALVHAQYDLTRELLSSLESEGLRLVTWGALTTQQRASLRSYFRDSVLPVLTPL